MEVNNPGIKYQRNNSICPEAKVPPNTFSEGELAERRAVFLAFRRQNEVLRDCVNSAVGSANSSELYVIVPISIRSRFKL